MKYKKYRLLILTLLLAIATVFMKPQPIQAATRAVGNQDFDVQVSCGLNGYSKYGSYIPIKLKITNNGSDFSGKLRIILDSEESTYQRIGYTKNVELSGGTSATLEFAIPGIGIAPVFDVSILDDEENKYFNQKIRTSIEYTDDIYIGILTDDFESMKYIEGMPFYVNSYGGYVSSRIFSLDGSNFSTDPLVLNNFDAIIINNFETSKLSQDQYEALKEWINEGGTLLIGTGNNYEKTLSLFKDGYLTYVTGQQSTATSDFDLNRYSAVIRSKPLEYEEETQEIVEENSDDTVQSDTDAKSDEVQENSMSSASTSADDSNVFITQELVNIDEITLETIDLKFDTSMLYPQFLCQSVEKGDGKIFILSFDLTSDVFKNWTYNMQAIQNMLVTLTNVTSQGSIRSSSADYYYVQDMLSNYISGKLPDIGPFIIIIVLYIILVVPGAYFILKKKDRRQWLWAIIPAAACIFTLFVFLVGNSVRERNPYINYCTILTSSNENTIEKTYFSVTSPRNKGFDFSVGNDYRISALLSNYYSSYAESEESETDDTYDINLTYSNDGTNINIKNINAFGSKYFYGQRKGVSLGKVETDITYVVDHYEGTITNHTGYTLENAFLKLDNLFLDIGTLADGETYAIDSKNIHLISSYYEVPERIDTITSERRRMLNGYIYGLYSSYYSSYIITPNYCFGAFVSDYPVDVAQASGYDYSGNALIWQDIEINQSTDGIYTTPSIFYNSQLLSGDMDGVDHYFYSDSIKFECHIPHQIQSIDSLNLVSPGSEDMLYYLYNWETDTYDQILSGESKKMTGNQLKPYIQDGCFRIQIKKVAEESYSSAVLPVFSLSGREK